MSLLVVGDGEDPFKYINTRLKDGMIIAFPDDFELQEVLLPMFELTNEDFARNADGSRREDIDPAINKELVIRWYNRFKQYQIENPDPNDDLTTPDGLYGDKVRKANFLNREGFSNNDPEIPFTEKDWELAQEVMELFSDIFGRGTMITAFAGLLKIEDNGRLGLYSYGTVEEFLDMLQRRGITVANHGDPDIDNQIDIESFIFDFLVLGPRISFNVQMDGELKEMFFQVNHIPMAAILPWLSGLDGDFGLDEALSTAREDDLETSDFVSNIFSQIFTDGIISYYPLKDVYEGKSKLARYVDQEYSHRVIDPGILGLLMMKDTFETDLASEQAARTALQKNIYSRGLAARNLLSSISAWFEMGRNYPVNLIFQDTNIYGISDEWKFRLMPLREGDMEGWRDLPASDIADILYAISVVSGEISGLNLNVDMKIKDLMRHMDKEGVFSGLNFFIKELARHVEFIGQGKLQIALVQSKKIERNHYAYSQTLDLRKSDSTKIAQEMASQRDGTSIFPENLGITQWYELDINDPDAFYDQFMEIVANVLLKDCTLIFKGEHMQKEEALIAFHPILGLIHPESLNFKDTDVRLSLFGESVGEDEETLTLLKELFEWDKMQEAIEILMNVGNPFLVEDFDLYRVNPGKFFEIYQNLDKFANFWGIKF